MRAETTLYRAAAGEPWKVSGFQVNVLSREELAGRTFEFMSEPPGVQSGYRGPGRDLPAVHVLMTFWVAPFGRD